MRPREHLALSTAAGGAVWAATGEPWAFPATIATGVLIDVDHSPDLWWTFALRRQPVATFLLHSWEWLAGLVVLGIWAGFPWWLAAVLVGYSLHVITDYLFNGRGLRSYFLIYRAINWFQAEKLFPGLDHSQAYGVLQKEVPVAARLIEWWNRRSIPGDTGSD